MPNFDELTPRERDCLERLDILGDIKSVARDLDLSPHTVNNHLQSAMRKLGVRRSERAARLYREHLDQLSETSLGQRSPVDVTPLIWPTPSQPEQHEERQGLFLQEERVAYSFETERPAQTSSALTRGKGERVNPLSVTQRLQAIVTIAACIGLICLITVLLGSALTTWALHRG